MDTRFSNDAARMIALVGAGAWLVLAIAWHLSDTFDDRYGWEGAARGAFMVGFIGLLLGGLALAAMALNRTQGSGRPKARVIGLGVLAVALVLSFIAGWAVPLWTAAYGLALLVLAWSGSIGRSGWIAGIGLATASIVWFALSALEVGTADVYGDYPVAWRTASWVGGVGAALGLIWWARSLRSESRDVVGSSR